MEPPRGRPPSWRPPPRFRGNCNGPGPRNWDPRGQQPPPRLYGPFHPDFHRDFHHGPQVNGNIFMNFEQNNHNWVPGLRFPGVQAAQLAQAQTFFRGPPPNQQRQQNRFNSHQTEMQAHFNKVRPRQPVPPPVRKPEPKPSLVAMCIHCKYFSSNFKECESCGKEMRPDARKFRNPYTLSKEWSGLVQTVMNQPLSPDFTPLNQPTGQVLGSILKVNGPNAYWPGKKVTADSAAEKEANSTKDDQGKSTTMSHNSVRTNAAVLTAFNTKDQLPPATTVPLSTDLRNNSKDFSRTNEAPSNFKEPHWPQEALASGAKAKSQIPPIEIEIIDSDSEGSESEAEPSPNATVPSLSTNKPKRNIKCQENLTQTQIVQDGLSNLVIDKTNNKTELERDNENLTLTSSSCAEVELVKPAENNNDSTITKVNSPNQSPEPSITESAEAEIIELIDNIVDLDDEFDEEDEENVLPKIKIRTNILEEKEEDVEDGQGEDDQQQVVVPEESTPMEIAVTEQMEQVPAPVEIPKCRDRSRTCGTLKQNLMKSKKLRELAKNRCTTRSSQLGIEIPILSDLPTSLDQQQEQQDVRIVVQCPRCFRYREEEDRCNKCKRRFSKRLKRVFYSALSAADVANAKLKTKQYEAELQRVGMEKIKQSVEKFKARKVKEFVQNHGVSFDNENNGNEIILGEEESNLESSSTSVRSSRSRSRGVASAGDGDGTNSPTPKKRKKYFYHHDTSSGSNKEIKKNGTAEKETVVQDMINSNRKVSSQRRRRHEETQNKAAAASNKESKSTSESKKRKRRMRIV